MNPYDPLICLLLAVSYIGRAFQRQADNRNYFVVQVRVLLPLLRLIDSRSSLTPHFTTVTSSQGLAFLDRYRKLHPQGPESDEVEYNFGACFHRLGTSCAYIFPKPCPPSDEQYAINQQVCSISPLTTTNESWTVPNRDRQRRSMPYVLLHVSSGRSRPLS